MNEYELRRRSTPYQAGDQEEADHGQAKSVESRISDNRPVAAQLRRIQDIISKGATNGPQQVPKAEMRPGISGSDSEIGPFKLDHSQQALPVQRKTAGATVNDRVRNSAGEIFTVLDSGGSTLRIKGRLASSPFSIQTADDEYEIVRPEPAPAFTMPLPPPMEALHLPPPERRTKWEILKEERALTDSEVSALQAYTTSTYAWINGYLRSGDDLNDDVKQRIVFWLVNTGVIGQLQRSDPKIDRLVRKLADAEQIAGTDQLPNKWAAAKPILEAIIQLIVSAMSKWPQPEQEEVTRGVGLSSGSVPEFVRQMHVPGRIAMDPGFLSTAFGTPFA
ncbi:MAG: ADP-ribosyltransferase, partial [Bacteroidota bacterium]